ncbi:hypothetical protein M2428_000607 [Arthrobacter sp. ES3-54]|nr:hypothetical protein [Arthrobacter sp. ES3-54]
MNNLWNQIQVIKLRFQMGVLSRAGYIDLGH